MNRSLTVKAFIHLFFLVLFVIAHCASSWAQDEPKPSDIRLVIDVSGSMKSNDPNNLRQPAVDLLVRLLPEGSRAGVWTFGKYVNMLVPLQDVDEGWREMARNKAREINSVGLFTNIGEALEKAAYNAGDEGKYNKSILLLTDGMVDISKQPEDNKKEWRRIVDEVLPELKDAGFTVHTVSLSAKADRDLMQKLALSTDGMASSAQNADELMKIFLEAFDVAAPAQQVPLVDNSFVVDSSVEEFTALIFREVASEESQLISPDEQVFNHKTSEESVRWFRADNYDLITVKQPIEGEWKIKAALQPESRVTIVSDLNLRVKSLPNNLYRGARHNLDFLLQEDGKTITRPEFLSLISSSAAVGYGEGDTSTKQIWEHRFERVPPANGVYRVALPEFKNLGTYDLQVVVDGKTFERRFTQRIKVREPFSAELSKVIDENGAEINVLTVTAQNDTIVPAKTQVAASVIGPDRRKVLRALKRGIYDNWQTTVPIDKVGEYEVLVRVTGTDTKGEDFEYLLDPVKLNHNPEADFQTEIPELPSEDQRPKLPVEAEETVVPAPEPVSAPVFMTEAKPTPEGDSESDVEPETGKEPEPEEKPEAESESQPLPPWLLYVILGVGNLVLLGGGFILFRKLFSDSGEDVLDKFSDENLQEPSEPEPQEPEEEISEEDMSMDEGDTDEEEPPMEDLDPVEDEMDMMDEPSEDESESEAPTSEPEEDDFGMDDIDQEIVEKVMGEDADEEEKDDFAQEVLKAQGLDLAEDELDDAINNLIDELDEDRSESDDIDDFDDFGLDEDEDK